MHCLVCISLLSLISTPIHLVTRLIGTNLKYVPLYIVNMISPGSTFLLDGHTSYGVLLKVSILYPSCTEPPRYALGTAVPGTGTCNNLNEIVLVFGWSPGSVWSLSCILKGLNWLGWADVPLLGV